MIPETIDVKRKLEDGNTEEVTLKVRLLEEKDIDQAYDFIMATREKMPDKSLFYVEDKETMFAPFVNNGIIIGLFDEHDNLVTTRYVALCEEGHKLWKHLPFPESENHHIAYNKSTVVDPAYRGNKLQLKTSLWAYEYVRAKGYDVFLSTISPKNPYSLKNLFSLGFSVRALARIYEHPETGEKLLRYILYLNALESFRPSDTERTSVDDIERQRELLDKGYRGTALEDDIIVWQK